MKIIQISFITLLLIVYLIWPREYFSQTTRVSIAYNFNIESEYISSSPLGIRLSLQYLLVENIKLVTSLGAYLHEFKIPTADTGLLFPIEESILYQFSNEVPVYCGGGIGYYLLAISYPSMHAGGISVENNFGYHFTLGYDKFDEGFFIEARFFNIITTLNERQDIYDEKIGAYIKEQSRKIDINSFSFTLGFYF